MKGNLIGNGKREVKSCGVQTSECRLIRVYELCKEAEEGLGGT